MTIVTITSDFTGKKAGSLIENPNIVRYTGNNIFASGGSDLPNTNILLPSEINETNQDTYDLVMIQNNSGMYSVNGCSQHTPTNNFFF